MKLLVEYMKELLKEDPMGFAHDLAASDKFGDQFFGGNIGKDAGREIKRAFNANADHQFLSTLDTVHWTGDFYGLKAMKGRGKDELSVTMTLPGDVFDPAAGLPYGLWVKGRITLATNEQDNMYSGFHGDYGPGAEGSEEEVAHRDKSSGRNKRPTVSKNYKNYAQLERGNEYMEKMVRDGIPYILDQSTWDPSKTKSNNEALIDNWRPRGIIIVKDDIADAILKTAEMLISGGHSAPSGNTAKDIDHFSAGVTKEIMLTSLDLGVPIYDTERSKLWSPKQNNIKEMRTYVRQLLMEVPLDDFEYLTQSDDDVMVREEVANYFKAIPQSVNIYVAHTDDLGWAYRLPNEIQGKVSGFKSRGQVTLTDISNIGKLYPQIQRAMNPQGINLLYVYPKSFEVPAGADTFIADVNPHYLAHDLHHMLEGVPRRGSREKDKFSSLIKEYLMELVWLSHGGGTMEAEQVRDSMKHTGRRLGVSNPDILLSDLFPGVKLPSGDFDLFGDIFADYLKNDGDLVLGVPEQLSMKNGDIIELNPGSKHDQRAQQYEKKFKDLFDTVLDPLKGKVAMFNIFEVENREVDRARKQAEEKMQVDHGPLIDHIKSMGGEFKYFDESYKEEGVEELIFDTGLKSEKGVMDPEKFTAQFPKEVEGIEALGYKITSAFDGFGQSPVEIRLQKTSMKESVLRTYIRGLLAEDVR